MARSARRTAPAQARGEPYIPPSHFDYHTNIDTDVDEDVSATTPARSEPEQGTGSGTGVHPIRSLPKGRPTGADAGGGSGLLVGEGPRALDWARAWSMAVNCSRTVPF